MLGGESGMFAVGLADVCGVVSALMFCGRAFTFFVDIAKALEQRIISRIVATNSFGPFFVIFFYLPGFKESCFFPVLAI